MDISIFQTWDSVFALVHVIISFFMAQAIINKKCRLVWWQVGQKPQRLFLLYCP